MLLRKIILIKNWKNKCEEIDAVSSIHLVALVLVTINIISSLQLKCKVLITVCLALENGSLLPVITYTS